MSSISSTSIPYREYPVDPNTFWVTADSPLIQQYTKIQQVMEYNFAQGFSGQTEEFFMGFDNYLLLCGDKFYNDYAKMGYDKAESFLRAEGYSENKASTVLSSLTLQYYALYQALEDLLFVGVDTETENEKKWFPTALFTRSEKILTYLEQNGQLANPLNVTMKKLNSKKETSIPKGLMPVVRLDPVSSEGGKPIFEAKIPQKSLDAGGGRQYALIPVGAYYMFANMLKTEGLKTPMYFEADSIIGKKASKIATSPMIYGKVYSQSGFSNEEIFANLKRMVVGFDITTQRFYAYNLEESFHNYGVISFRPEMLNALKPIDLKDIDNSRHTINYPLVRAVYKTKIRNLTEESAEEVALDNFSSYANLYDFKEALILRGNRMSNKELFTLMKQNPLIFGDLDEEVEKHKQFQLKYLKDLRPVELPNSNAERRDLLETLLRTGVVRITAKRKTSNSILEVYATNSIEVLTQILGDDYVQKYETVRIRLHKAKDILESQDNISRSDFEGLLVTYNIRENIMSEMVDLEMTPTMPSSSLVPFFDNAIERLIEASKARNISPTNILYRNIYAGDHKELYGNVDASNLIDIEYQQM